MSLSIRRSAAQRAALFASVQAKFTAEELEVQEEEHRTLYNKPMAHTYAYELKAARRWFHEFMEDQHPDVDVDATYFKLGAAAPDHVILKEYARYISRSRTGILDDKLSARTVSHYLEMLILAMKHECRFSDLVKDASREVHNFIHTILVEKEGLRTIAHTKAVVHSEDLTEILSRLYTPKYLTTFSNMRQVLNLTLYMLLMVDCTERGCGIARNPQRPEHMCLRWEDVDFYAFQVPGEGAGSLDIRANVTIRWAKGDSKDESKFKVVPFTGLLPTSMAIEDTLRLLLTLALVDGVLDHGIKTWDDLYRIRLSKDEARTGRKIAVKPSMRTVPLLRRMDGKHRLTLDPVQTNDIHPQIRRLGRFCGFENRFVGYCLRRGVAYILATQTTVENRMFLMGHSSPDEYKPYQSKISTIDFSRMFRGLDSAPVLIQSGISLNRSDTAPQRISDAGYQSILEREEVAALIQQQQDLRDRILAQHSSLSSAARTNDPLWHEYKQLSMTRKTMIDGMVNRVYKAEYRQHFENLSARPEPICEPAETDDDCGQDSVQGRSDESQSTLSDQFTEQEIMSLMDDSNLMGQAQDDMLNDIMEDETPTEVSEDQQAASPTMDIVHSDKDAELTSTRLHGLPDQLTGRGKNRALAPRRGLSAYHDLREELVIAEGDEAAVFKALARWFSVTHGIDDFPPGQEPTPGTFDCPFCGKDLSTFHKASEHTYSCALKDAQQRAQDLCDQTSPLNRPCDYQVCGIREHLHQFVDCGETFSSLKEMGEHMRFHLRTMEKRDEYGDKVPTCFFGSCAANPEGGRIKRDGPDFESLEERLEHVWSEHQV